MFIIIFAIACLLRLFQIGDEGLWSDEMGSLQDAELFWQSPTLQRPLYFALLNVWMKFGHSDVWLRLLSVLFGLWTVWLIWRLASTYLSKSTGLIAASMVAISPLFINHSQEIRMYSLSSALSLLGTYLFLQALHQPHWTNRLGWALSRGLAVLTMPLNILLMVPDAVLYVWTWRKRPQQLNRFAICSGLTLFCALPTLYAQIGGGAASDFLAKQVVGYAKPGLLQVVGMVTQFSVHWPLRSVLETEFDTQLAQDQLGDATLLSYFLTHLNGTLLFYGGISVVLILLASGALWRGLQSTHTRKIYGAIAAWAVLPSIAVLLVSYQSSSLWFPRYLLGFAPYYIILIAAGFAHLRQHTALAMALASSYLIGNAIALKDYYGPQPYRNDWSQASQIVQSLEQPGDTIVYYSVPRHYRHSFPRYYSGESPIVYASRPPQATHLEVDYARQSLSPTVPIESRVWIVCWWFCDSEAGATELASTVVGDRVTLIYSDQLHSLGHYPIGIYLFAPRTAAVKADANISLSQSN